MTEHGYVVKEFLQDPKKMEILFESLTGAGTSSRHSAREQLHNLRLILTRVKESGTKQGDTFDRIIEMATAAKVAGSNMIKEDSPVGELDLYVDFCQWIADYDGAPPGNLPVRYMASTKLIGHYISHVKKFFPDSTPTEWATRLNIRFDEATASKKSKK